VSYRLGINLGFAINRYIEPEVWARIVGKDLGLRYVQFVADLLNPFWPQSYIDLHISRIKAACVENGVEVPSIFTSAFTRVNHLMNPDAEARAFWLDWFKRLLDIGAALGAKTAGSHFGIMTFDTYNDAQKRAKCMDNAIKLWQDLSFYAQDKGYDALLFEPMSVPRENADTIAKARELMNRVNAHCGVPLKVNLDVGHAPDPSERDPYKWILALAADAPVIHLQQTVLNHSNHSPFTAECNKTGIITREKVMECVKKAGCTDALFAFEISHREHSDTDYRVVQDLKESVDYWRKVITL
jgi:sugar phosphate isomerase/epimerase